MARHAQFSFMDGFSGYSQIRMAEEDKIKTTFTTMWGTFCYRVMPFGLKNAGATYQRAMVTLFHDMMHKEVEYKLRLNPTKCTFGARSGKLLGFVVSERGIEVDPDKVKAIKELPPPSSVREVRGFLGRLNYIARFIANLTDKCQPLFRLLRKNAVIEWDEECQKAFDTIKAYLVQPPMYFDGAVNSTGSGIGAVLISPDGHYYLVAAKIDFPCTNNVAEYEACILGLQAAIDFKVKELEVFGDSMLTIFQILGQWKTKDAKLVLYHEYLEKLTENFENISFTYTPRMTNQFADALAALASMANPWYENIKNLLRTGQYPPFADRRDRKTLRRLAIHYFLSGEILYRRSFNSKKIIEKMTVNYKDWHEMLPYALLASKTTSRRPRQKLGNEWRDLKSCKGGSRQKESTSHFLARSKTSSRRPRQKLEDPRGAIPPKRGGS
ncbi:hypothetical protein CRG98_020037 [Punica granatum]|uniref:RNase H type-1 domain-containing protein n=1 Tax=Punica granatum TaxID=22663 RepID=A0A2I0JTE9_PUNGR|nr:hypothetical protein CRG98_020037 [Punica granatum]